MAQMIDKYDAITKKYSLKKVAKIHNKTKLDGSFQRYGGVDRGSGWDLDNSIKYLTNLLAGSTYNCVIIASVADCYNWAEQENNQEDMDYYKAVMLEGKEYISIDGNNTTSSVAAFVDGYEDLYVVRHGKKMKLADFSEDDRDDILDDEKINYVILRKIGIEDMCNLFRDLNTSTKLNKQEWRQARWSMTSQFIREISNGANREQFGAFVFHKNSDLDKRQHEETVAQLVSKIKTGYGKLSASDQVAKFLDELYENTLSLPKNTQNKVKTILEISRTMVSSPESSKMKKIGRGGLHALWDVIEITTYEHSLKINKPEKLLEWFLKNHNKFIADAKDIPLGKEKDQSYVYWINLFNRHAYWKKSRALLKSTLVGDLEDLVSDGIVTYKRTSRDSFTWEEKLQLLREQNYETRRGEKMTYLDLYLGKYEADHVVSVKDGGKTEITNGELMLKEDNRKKGSDSNEPHFLHQIPEEQQLEIAINE